MDSLCAMNSVPLYHLSPVGREAIDVESARIRRELADRRAERQSCQQLQHAHGFPDRSTAPLVDDAEATDPPRHALAMRP
jgi:hypothetical protein